MNCLTYALDRWNKTGGSLRISLSDYWDMPHVMHESSCGVVTRYAPRRRLKRPWHALFGFDGRVRAGANGRQAPIPMRGIVFGAVVMFVTVLVWAVTTKLKGK